MMANDCSSEDNASGSKSSIFNLDTANIWGQINLCWGQGLPVPPRTLSPLLRLCPCHARGTFPWVMTTRCLQTLSDVPWGPKLPLFEKHCSTSTGFPGGASGEESAYKRHSFDPWVRKVPWRRTWQPTLVFLPGEVHGQRSLAGCSLCGHKELDMTERLKHTCFK